LLVAKKGKHLVVMMAGLWGEWSAVLKVDMTVVLLAAW
jgi:hypothetical protein